MPVMSFVGYCPCGAEIWIEYLPGKDGWSHRFFSMDHREVADCPECGRRLHEDELESK